MFTMSVTPLGKVFGWLINQPSAMKHTSIHKIEFRIRDCALTSEKYKTRSDLESVFHNRCWVVSPISKRGQLILTVTLSYITPITCRVLPFLLLAPIWFLSINPHKQRYIILKCMLNHYWRPLQSIPDLLLEPPFCTFAQWFPNTRVIDQWIFTKTCTVLSVYAGFNLFWWLMIV